MLSIVDNRTFKRLAYEVLDHDPTHADIRAFFERFQSALQQRGLRVQAITTDDFLSHFEGALPGVLAQVDAPAWLDGEGVPASVVRPHSERLTAIRALFRYAALRHPQDAAVIQQVLAIPPKRFDRAVITYLTEEEITALLAAPDRSTWTGRRDHALLLLACQTGLRATELTGLTVGDVHLGSGRHVSCLGKGRKRRITPLTAATGTVLHAWLAERAGLPNDPLFVTRRGTPLSRDALQRRVARYAAIAAASCPTLQEKKVSPHVLRHSAAMRCSAPVSTSP